MAIVVIAIAFTICIVIGTVLLNASVTHLPTWKFVAVGSLFLAFSMLTLGAFTRYSKYRRTDDLFHACAYYGAANWGLLQGRFTPFLIGVAIVLVVGNLAEYKRRRRDHPSVDDLSRSILDDKHPKTEAQKCSKVINAAFEDPDNSEVRRLFKLTKDDFGEVFQRMLNSRPWTEAELALHNPEILEWFFTNVGRNGRFTPNQAVELGVMIVRNVEKER